MADEEEFYDREIEPVLLELCKKCQERGIPFVALCQFAEDGTGRTEFVPLDANATMRLAHFAASAKNNFDIFAEFVRRYAIKYGTTSTAARILVEHGPFASLRDG